jgi:hypothetical protein
MEVTMKSLISSTIHSYSVPLSDGAFLSKKILGLVAPEGVIMLDFDLPVGGHENSLVDCVTVQTREEAIERLEVYAAANPSVSFYVQNTAGGIRAFIAQDTDFDNGLRISAELNADPAYRMIAQGQGYMTIRIGNKWEEDSNRQRTGQVRPEVWEKPWMIGNANPDHYMACWVSYYWGMCQKYDGIASWMTQEEHERLLEERREERRLNWLTVRKAAGTRRNEAGLTDKQQALADRMMRKWIVANPGSNADKRDRALAAIIRKVAQ